MRKIIAYEYVTLDGVMESPEKWQFPYLTGDTAEFNMEQALAPEASLLGKVTYESSPGALPCSPRWNAWRWPPVSSPRAKSGACAPTSSGPMRKVPSSPVLTRCS